MMETLKVPYGMRDHLPGEAARMRGLETKLVKLFSTWGYDEVSTPTIEYLDTLTLGGNALELHMFKLFDRGNETVALRHEMTTPIARLAASRLSEAPMPLKLSYCANVFRYEQAQTGRQCEFRQAGVELLGAGGAEADAEVIALAVASLSEAGLADFQISIGHAGFIRGLMEQAGLDAKSRENVEKALERHDLVELRRIMKTSGVSGKTAEILSEIPLLCGKKEIIDRVYPYALSEESRRSLDNLSEIYRMLGSYGAADNVMIDLGVVRDFGYYTGMVFEAYASGIGFPLAGGGRYDRLLSSFGRPCPATGFATGIERIAIALGESEEFAAPKDMFIAYAEGNREQAIHKAKEVRDDGHTAELAFTAMDEKTALKMKNEKGYSSLIYIK